MPPVEFQDSWNGQMGASLVWGLNHKINMCQANLRNWNRTSFGHVRNLLSQKLRELKLAEELDGYRTNPTCIYQLQDDIEMLKSKEECMWKQRSRNTWLKEGDHNTRGIIFWVWIMKLVFGWRRKISWEIWWKNIFRICHHFKSIGFDDILSGIQPIVIAEMNEAFTCEFRAEEVQQALK